MEEVINKLDYNYIYNDGFWTFVPHVQLPSLWSPNCPPQLKNFPASTFTPQQLTTTSIHFDHSCHHKFFSRTTKRTCQKWNHDVKNETTMSKLCQTCQKSSTNPQRVNFHFVKIHAAFCLHQWKLSVRFGPLMTSMKTDFVTKIWH